MLRTIIIEPEDLELVVALPLILPPNGHRCAERTVAKLSAKALDYATTLICTALDFPRKSERTG